MYWSQIYVFALITTILNFYLEQTTICIFNSLSYKYLQKNGFSLNEKKRFRESMYLGGFWEGVSPLNHAKYLFFRDLILKTISSLTSDLKKLI